MFLLEAGKYAILIIIKGKTPFNILWLAFDERAELDLRLTKNFITHPFVWEITQLTSPVKIDKVNWSCLIPNLFLFRCQLPKNIVL